MNKMLRIPLHASPEQSARLQALQATFAEACNTLSPLVQKSRVWNRVALHHLAYKELRQKYPDMGSQMICNVIYSVSRTSRLVFHHPASPFNVARLGERTLPLLRFTANSPVYFDRHTLSIKEGQLSLYALGGRMHFNLCVHPRDRDRFENQKLREIVLSRRRDGLYQLAFWFSDDKEEPAASVPDSAHPARLPLPKYVQIEEAA